MHENIKAIIVIGTVLVLGFWVLNGFTFSNIYDASHTVRIDCSNPENAKYNQYCNGTYQGEVDQQNYNENSYYQNVVR